jgi:hypothetical protein
MVKKFIIGVVAAFALFLGFVAVQPNEFKVSRSIKIGGAPDVVFPHINDLHLFNEWNPYAKIDPAMKTTYEGPAAGIGAMSGWDGNRDVGAGKMTITQSQAPELVIFQLDFYKPMTGTNLAEFSIKPAEAGSEVTWSMTGQKNFVSKMFCLFMSMDKMVGGQFEKGLTNLKNIVETGKIQP